MYMTYVMNYLYFYHYFLILQRRRVARVSRTFVLLLYWKKDCPGETIQKDDPTEVGPVSLFGIDREGVGTTREVTRGFLY